MLSWGTIQTQNHEEKRFENVKNTKISPFIFRWIRPRFSTFYVVLWYIIDLCICWWPKTVYPTKIGQKTCPESRFKIIPNFGSFWPPNSVILVKKSNLRVSSERSRHGTSNLLHQNRTGRSRDLWGGGAESAPHTQVNVILAASRE